MAIPAEFWEEQPEPRAWPTPPSFFELHTYVNNHYVDGDMAAYAKADADATHAAMMAMHGDL